MAYVLVTVFGAIPGIRALRPLMVKLAELLDLALCDRLESLTFALAWANAEYEPPGTSTPPEQLTELVSEGERLRARMFHGLQLLAEWGLFNVTALAEITNARGAANIALDLTLLCKPYLHNWAAFEGKTPLTRDQLERAIVIGGQLLQQKGVRDRTPAEIAASALLRQQTFTLFMMCYDEVRAAVVFLRRHEGDADIIAPSLYTGRGNGGRRRADDETHEAESSAQRVVPAVQTPGAAESSEDELPVGNMPKSPYSA